MRRSGNLYDSIADPENLRLAFWKARRGKNGKADVQAFRANLTEELAALREQLVARHVYLGDYHYFTIHDPKERRICAAPFRERVLHHAIMNVSEPVFDRRQIHDSYACRKDKGLHACLERARHYTRRHAWYLKLDVRKYFDSIPQDRLAVRLRRIFKDRRLLDLLDRLIGSYSATPGRGIPIGNLTSQYFANEYLCPADHMIKEQLRIPGYVRYMDDMVLWHDDKVGLLAAERAIREHCAADLSLQLKPLCLNRTAMGVSMLGYRVLPSRVLLDRRSRRRFVGKLRGYWRELNEGNWTEENFAAHVLPLCAYVGHADSAGFRRRAMTTIGCSP